MSESPASDFAHARLQWDDQGQPISASFGDVYFSRANGLAETRHVFLHHNQLTERWLQLKNTAHFTIAETGFGSGLNFLAAWDLWVNVAPVSAQLHFISVEKFPLTKLDLERALALWPELDDKAQQLIEAYPQIIGTGFHRLNFSGGRIRLTLIINDAAHGFGQLLATTHPLFERTGPKVDAWFLDGFAPSKNPAMWSDELFDAIDKLSKANTTAATFSAAAIVKNGLKRAGFSIQKVAGFGRKRDMVKAVYERLPELKNPADYLNNRSYSPYPAPWTIQHNKPVFADKTALIIGGGLAGCHSARALAERGWQVKIVERHPALAEEASGNPQGVLYAKLSPQDEPQAEFNLASLQYALHFYAHLWKMIGEQCGVLQLAYKKSEQDLHQQLFEKFTGAGDLVKFVTATEASAIAGVGIQHGGLFFPSAGSINPRKLCTWLVDHPNIHTVFTMDIQRLEYRDNIWKISAESNDEISAPVVVIANAKDAAHFSESQHFPLKSIRGQLTYLPTPINPPAIKTVICAEGYIGPLQDNTFYTGATFNLKDNERDVRVSDHGTNLANIDKYLPDVSRYWKNVDVNTLPGRVAFRCSLPDYLPLVGPVPILENLVRDFAALRKNAKAGITSAGSYYPGLYINVGHGSRGLAYTPLAAELLAAQINNEFAPIPTSLANALHPGRFIIRDLIRNKR